MPIDERSNRELIDHIVATVTAQRVLLVLQLAGIPPTSAAIEAALEICVGTGDFAEAVRIGIATILDEAEQLRRQGSRFVS